MKMNSDENAAKKRESGDGATQSEPFPQKLYYKIGEVGEITGIPSHVLRFWEKQFPQLAPNKTRSDTAYIRSGTSRSSFTSRICSTTRDTPSKGQGSRSPHGGRRGSSRRSPSGSGELLGRLREGLQRILDIVDRPNPFDS